MRITKKKKNSGGARPGAGAKPKKDKKKQVQLSVLESKIEQLGGEDKLKEICYFAIDNS